MRILQVSAEYFKPTYVEDAITLLQKGQVIAFPTDTLYGIGADLNNEEAVQKLYSIKERPSDLPLILLGASKEALLPYVLDWTPLAEKLSQKFWPGGLTMILKKSFKVPDFVVSGFDTVGVRVPNHPVLLRILEAYGKPLATSSANISGSASTSTGRHVAEELYETELALLLDAGKTPFSEQSTLIDLSGEIPIILREGVISCETINLEMEKLI